MAEFLNNNIRHLRNEKSISQQELADKIGVDRSTISRIENGEIETTIDNAVKMAKVLGVPLIDLLSKDLRFDNCETVELPKRIVKIPVYGTIKAGTPLEAQNDIVEYIDIPEEMTKGGKLFYGLRISGDSMQPKYQENDIVIFEHINDMSLINGKDCAVMVNGYDATFKNVRVNPAGIQLIPLNINNSDGYEPTFYNQEDIEKLPVKVMGIAIEKRTRL